MRNPRTALWKACSMLVVLGLAGLTPGVAAEPVYVEDSPAAMELANRAQQWRDQGRLTDAVAAWQELVERYPTKLMPAGPGSYVDAVWWVRRTLIADDELRAVYERTAEPLAARALAEALESARPGEAAEGWYDDSALAEVGRRYWLTRSGLEANLTLAAIRLERGDASGARAVLEQVSDHPALPELRERVQALRAGATEVAAALAEWMGDASGASLRAVLASAGVDTDHAGFWAPAPLDAALWQVWAKDLSPVLSHQVARQLPGRRGGQATQLTAMSVLPEPALSAERVWVNDGQRVSSLDRASGRPVWVFDAWRQRFGDTGYTQQARAVMQMSQVLPDRRGVLVGDGAVWAVAGRSAFTRNAGRMPVGAKGFSTHLVCLDAGNGTLRWSLSPGDLDETLERTQFMGTPLRVGPGVVAVRVRRVQMSGFVDSFVVGLDAGTGDLRWKRHLASSALTINMQQLPPARPMVMASGRLIVDEGLGVAAALDPRDGAVWWLRVTAEGPMQPPGAVRTNRGLMPEARGGGPVVLQAGVLTGKLGDAESALLLDVQTGEVLSTLSAREHAWLRGAAWLATEDGGLLSVGRRLYGVDGRTLDVVWETALPREAEQAAAGDNTVAQPVLDGGWAVVPVGGKLLRVRLDRGEIVAQSDANMSAMLVAAEGDVFAASPQAVNGYTAVPRAEAALRARIARQPGVAEPGLALATLGVRAEAKTLLLDGVDAALSASALAEESSDVSDDTSALEEATAQLDALLGGETGNDQEDRGDTAGVARHDTPAAVPGSDRDNPTVVLELIALVSDADEISPATRRVVFNKVAGSLTGPSELVAYHLALGPLEEQAGRAQEAASHYQAVLRDTLLAERLVEVAGTQRRAGLEAKQRLTRLVAREGFAIYAPFEAQAGRELAGLLADAGTTPERLSLLAERYPLSEAGARALLEAARRLEGRGDLHEAIGPYRRAYRMAREGDTLAAAAGELASLYQKQGRPVPAAGWLQRVAREHPGLRLARAGGGVDVDTWLAELAQMNAGRVALPALQLPLADRPWIVPGVLSPIDPAGLDSHRPDLAVTRVGAMAIICEPARRRIVAEVPVTARDATVLRFSDDQLLMWSPSKRSVIRVDVGAPRPTAEVINAQELLGKVGPIDRALAVRAPEAGGFGIDELEILNEQVVEVRNGRVVARNQQGNPRVIFCAANETLLLLADQVGRVVALDRHTAEPIWQYRFPGDVISAIKIDDETAVLTGVTGFRTEAQSGMIAALDLLTGAPRFDPIQEDPQAPADARPLPDGTLLATFPSFVAAYALDSGDLLWRTPRPFDVQQPFATPPVLGDGFIALTFNTPAPPVLMIEPATGEVEARVVLATLANPPVVPQNRLLAVDGRLHTLGSSLACFTPPGYLLWRDAVRDERFVFLHQWLSAEHVLVIAQDTRAPAEQGPRYKLFAFERETGRVTHEQDLDHIPGTVVTPFTRLMHRHLAVSNASQTFFYGDTPRP